MTYSSSENSLEGGRPIEIYEITLGFQIYRYTSSQDDQVVLGQTYLANGIARDRVKQGQEVRSSGIILTMPSDDPFASRYVSSAPSERAVVVIQRFHRGDGQLSTVFIGRAKSVAFGGSKDGREAQVSVEPAITAAAKEVPLFTFRGQCNNVLGDALDPEAGGLCDVDLDDPAYLHSAECTAQTGLLVTVPGAAAFGDGWFDGGTIETSVGTDARMVLRQVGDVLTLHIGFPFPIVGETVRIRAGCAHDIQTCSDKFDRVGVFQGFSWVPIINVFESSLEGQVC